MTKSREIRQKILKIMDLALKISPPEKTREEHEPSASVEYSAHVNMITVRCFKYGDYHGRADYEASIYMDEKCANEKLDKLIKHLRELREEMNNVSEN